VNRDDGTWPPPAPLFGSRFTVLTKDDERSHEMTEYRIEEAAGAKEAATAFEGED
jgi:hypothetical protein